MYFDIIESNMLTSITNELEKMNNQLLSSINSATNDIDKFGKGVTENIDKANEDVFDMLIDLFSTMKTNVPKLSTTHQPKTSTYNPYS